MQIEIHDDFDLQKIAQSGQCFRARSIGKGTFRFVTGNHLLYIHPLEPNRYSASCQEEEWHAIWRPYFDLDCNYRSIRAEEACREPYVQQAMEYGCGLRILRQDPWEMLVTFIISQRKSIPAISKAVEALASRYGHPLKSDREKISSFPTAHEMQNLSVKDLQDCGLGYRAAYVHDAIQKVVQKTIDLDAIAEHDDERLFQELLQVHGVGKKVANCVCLFGYGRKSCVPVDVWISRAMSHGLRGKSLAELFGKKAGIIQQYVFFYERNHGKNNGSQASARQKDTAWRQ